MSLPAVSCELERLGRGDRHLLHRSRPFRWCRSTDRTLRTSSELRRLTMAWTKAPRFARARSGTQRLVSVVVPICEIATTSASSAGSFMPSDLRRTARRKRSAHTGIAEARGSRRERLRSTMCATMPPPATPAVPWPLGRSPAAAPCGRGARRFVHRCRRAARRKAPPRPPTWRFSAPRMGSWRRDSGRFVNFLLQASIVERSRV